MIGRITYNIRFPLGGIFENDPEYLFIKTIYKEIYYCSCLNKIKCNECHRQEQCLYYLLSGENFKMYPSIVVNRKMVNKKVYDSNDVLSITFYLFGIATNYIDFITEFFNTTEYISNYFFQKVLVDKEIINDNENYTGNIDFITPIISIEDIYSSIRYYNNKYKCKMSEPKIEQIEFGIKLIDTNRYFFGNTHIKIEGYKANFKANNYPCVLLTSGVGKIAILGGGQAKCV